LPANCVLTAGAGFVKKFPYRFRAPSGGPRFCAASAPRKGRSPCAATGSRAAAQRWGRAEARPSWVCSCEPGSRPCCVSLVSATWFR